MPATNVAAALQQSEAIVLLSQDHVRSGHSHKALFKWCTGNSRDLFFVFSTFDRTLSNFIMVVRLVAFSIKVSLLIAHSRCCAVALAHNKLV